MTEPRTGISHFVLAEFRGGPKDGERRVLHWPIDPELRFPAQPVFSVEPLPLPSSGHFAAHVYRNTDLQHYEPVAVAEIVLKSLKSAPSREAAINEITARRKPIIFTHQGIQ